MPKKEKASKRKTIPIPAADPSDSDVSEVAEEDLDYFKDVPSSGVFLNNLDVNGISRYVRMDHVIWEGA